MKILSELHKYMLLDGAKTTGSYVEGLEMHAENLTFEDYAELNRFAQWIEAEVGGAGNANIDRLYECYQNSDDSDNKEFVRELRERIESFRKLTA